MSSHSALAVPAFKRISSNSGLMMLLCMLLCAASAFGQQTLGSVNAAAFGPPPPLMPEANGANGVPPCDPVSGACDYFETGYTTGGRNIFRAPFQSRFDFGVFKTFRLTERFSLRYDAQAFNIFNHPSFDVPNNSVLYVTNFENPPIYGQPGSGTTPCIPLPVGPNIAAGEGAFHCPPVGHLGVIQHTIGSPRFLQMALHLTF